MNERHPQSFDLFDTLIAGRDIRIAAGNQPGQYPIAENVQKVLKDDIIVSDYDDQARAQKVVREICKLPNCVLVTPSGKWDGWIWDKLPSYDHHTGDNQRADVDQPIAHGKRATRSTQHELTPAEGKLVQLG